MTMLIERRTEGPRQGCPTQLMQVSRQAPAGCCLYSTRFAPAPSRKSSNPGRRLDRQPLWISGR